MDLNFERELKVSADRLGALVGKNGTVKKEIEERCGVVLQIDSKTGDVSVSSEKELSQSDPFKAVDIVTAISKGFSPERAFRLLGEEEGLSQLDLREYAGKSENDLSRIKGRIIGLDGKTRRILEELTGTYVSIYGHIVSVVGRMDQNKLALDAIDMLASGSSHKSMYNMLQGARTKTKIDRMKLWEDNQPG